MQNLNSKSSSRDIVEKDAADIYLGNLNTVDSDLILPRKGVRGSAIQWHSGETLFLSHEGKVTRPTHGVGNRVVPLAATLTYEDAVFQKNFAVTVIEQPSVGNITAVHPVNLVSKVHGVPELPSVVIVEKDTGSVTTAQVQWCAVEKKLFDSAGSFSVSGRVEASDVPAVAHIRMAEKLPDTQTGPAEKRVHSFPSGKVRLAENSQFLKAQDAFLRYLLDVNDDQMLYNFRAAAGLDTQGALPMTGWDSPDCNLKGHTTGHYLSALSLAYASTYNERIREKLAYMVEELAACQDAMSAKPGCREGFLSAYSEEQFDLLEAYTTYPKIWAPYYTLHKIMAGLLDSYRHAGMERALTVCSRLGDWVYNRLRALPKEQLKKMWSMYIAGEFGGIMEVLVDLYFATGNTNYLTTAEYFINDKLYYPMSENVDTLEDMHVNQHIPQIIGAIKLFEAQGNGRYFRIAENFWSMVAHGHVYNIGGIGENEMFKRSEKIAAFLSEKTAESCATYNMLKLTKELFMYAPQAAYMDYYEKALFNHILSACDLSEPIGGTTYFMPLAPASHKSFDTAQNTCCHGTGLESPFKLTEAVYFHDADSLYVNLYIPSRLVWDEKNIIIFQESSLNDLSEVTLKIDGPARFTLKLRKPDWANGPMEVLLNGAAVPDGVPRDGYWALERDWNHDTLQIKFPLSFCLEPTPDNPQIAGLSYGPYTLVALTGCDEYLTFDVNESNINDKVKTIENGSRYELEGVPFAPLNQVSHEAFSAYFRIKP